jgi:uncharacterized protein YfkK (UPF0435 family)
MKIRLALIFSAVLIFNCGCSEGAKKLNEPSETIQKFQSWRLSNDEMDNNNDECTWLFNLKKNKNAFSMSESTEIDCSQNILYEDINDDEVTFSSTCTGDVFKLSRCDSKYMILVDYHSKESFCPNEMDFFGSSEHNYMYIDEKYEHLIGQEWQCKKNLQSKNIYECAQEGYEFQSSIEVVEIKDALKLIWDGREVLLRNACKQF